MHWALLQERVTLPHLLTLLRLKPTTEKDTQTKSCPLDLWPFVPAALPFCLSMCCFSSLVLASNVQGIMNIQIPLDWDILFGLFSAVSTGGTQ